jgi:undecaprenyl diphosphate synthase
MELLRTFLTAEREEILLNGIRLTAVGQLDRLPAPVREVLEAIRAASASNEGMTLSLALSYGGREEIAAAAKGLAEEVASGRLAADAIDAALLASRIPSLAFGEPDLIIRTGGEQRISNFLLYGAAYSELAFSEKLWPDFDEEDLFQAIQSFQNRERRFGRVLRRSSTALDAPGGTTTGT